MRDLNASTTGEAGRISRPARPGAGYPDRPSPPSTLDATFADILKVIMGRKGLTQYRLVQLSGLGADTICRLAQGTRNPTETQVLRIGIALELNRNQIGVLLDIAGFYPFPPLGDYRPTGAQGWPKEAVAAQLISSRRPTN